MMEILIRHLVVLTSQRNHGLMEMAVVRTLHAMLDAVRVRALEVFSFEGELYVRPRAWVQDDHVVASAETVGADHGGELISEFPTLLACMSEHINSAEETTAAGDYVLWLPIWLNDKLSSCLQITSTTPYSKQDRNLIEGILGIYRNQQSLLDYSERDSLTGLLNRKTFDEKFSKMAVDCIPDDHSAGIERRHHADVQEQWLAVVDVDHFKRVNDQFGHLYGDEVLILIANMLRQSFRDHDRLFRFGGEEFVILLRSATLDDAGKAFERFRADVETHHFPQVGRMTVSVGFARINQSETPVMLLGNADRALYYAKANGRNRVHCFEELLSSGALRSQVAQESAEFFFDGHATVD